MGGTLIKILGPKACIISVDVVPLQNSIANISGMGQNIQNRKDAIPSAILPAFDEESPVNFGPLTTKNCM